MRVISGKLVDILQRRIHTVEVAFENGKIISIVPNAKIEAEHYILPGFVDAHVHIESSMLVPAEFARLAVVHGTVGTVSDPHEIANVCGLPGVEFMIENGRTVPFKFNFGAPSCVPATRFETAGATLNAADVEKLLQREDIKYLSEMMNFPGVLTGDEEVMQKIAAARKCGKPVDGHAPGLRGEQAQQYIEGGPLATTAPANAPLAEPASAVVISTDHECFTAEEALDKLRYGMKILIREGSAAKNFEALAGLLHEHADKMMFCSDDKHPDSLVAGHINQLCARAVAKGIDLFNVLLAACINPVTHYKLNIGLLQRGDPADFIVVKDLEHFEVLQTYIDGELVAENGSTKIAVGGTPESRENPAARQEVNQFNCQPLAPADFNIPYQGQETIPVIEALDGQLITNKLQCPPKTQAGYIVSDTGRDILKMVVVNRYHPAPIAKAFIKNIGLRQGAIASSVAHDSHNIVAVGADDESLCRAVNLVIAQKGGVSCVSGHDEKVLALPVAGLMSHNDGYQVAEAYTAIDAMAKSLGSPLAAPFMTLSFMALLVIPHLKLSDKGLFDGDAFAFV